jgi:hypothetical protein
MNKLRVFKIWPAFAILSLLLVFSSCGKDDDPIDDRDQFVSTFDVNESYDVDGTTYTAHYSMTITKSAQDPSVILLSNLGGFNTPIIIKATVNRTNFIIPQQTVAGNGFSGSGNISGTTISFSYQQSATGIGVWNVSATGIKM